MNILLINYEFPPLGGGAGNATAQIARHLVRLGSQVDVLTSHYKGLPRNEEIDGYRVHRVPTVRRRVDRCSLPEMGVFLLSGLYSSLIAPRRLKPDIVCTFFTIPCGPMGLTVKKAYRVPYVVSLRGADVPGFQPYDLGFYHRLTKPLIRYVWRNSGAVVANSKGLRDLALTTSPSMPIEMIPNGIDLERFHPGSLMRSGDTVKLLFVGRLVQQKGLPHLLESLASVLSKGGAKIELEIVGDGNQRIALESMSEKLGLDQAVRFSGWCSRERIVEKYQQADIFVFPSLDEGMPNVVLEAMGCGLPIIATNISGNEELVRHGKNGFLFSVGDTVAMSNYISQMVDSVGLRREMGAQSRAIAETYDWSEVARRYLELFEEVIRQRKS